MYEASLKAEGYNLKTVKSTEEYFDYIDTTEVSLSIISGDLTNVDFSKLTHSSLERIPPIHIIFAAGKDSTSTIEEFLCLDKVSLMKRPFSLNALTEKINTILLKSSSENKNTLDNGNNQKDNIDENSIIEDLTDRDVDDISDDVDAEKPADDKELIYNLNEDSLTEDNEKNTNYMAKEDLSDDNENDTFDLDEEELTDEDVDDVGDIDDDDSTEAIKSTSVTLAGEIDKLQRQFEQELSKQTSFEKTLSSRRNRIIKDLETGNEQLKERLKLKEERLERRKREMEQRFEIKLSSITAEKERLYNEVERLRTQLEREREDRQLIEEEHVDEIRRLEINTVHNTEMRIELDSLRSELSTSRDEAQIANERLDDCECETKHLLEEISDLRSDNDELSKENISYTHDLEELRLSAAQKEEDLHESIEEQDRRTKALQQELAENTREYTRLRGELERQLDERLHDLELARTEKRNLESRLAGISSNHESEVGKLERERATLRQALEEYEQKLKTITSEQRDISNKREGLIDDLERISNKLKDELNDSRNEVSKLQKESETGKNEFEQIVNQQGSEITRLAEENERLNRYIDEERESTIAKITGTRNKLVSMETEKEKLRKDLQLEIKQQASKVSLLAKTHERLSQESERLIDNLEITVNHLKNELEQTTRSLEEQSDDTDNLRDDKHKLETKIHKMEDKLRKAEAAFKSMEKNQDS